jgi:hypothetical protein
MGARGWLLLAFALFTTVFGVGALFGTPLLPSAGLLAWLALCGYVLVAGREGAPLVRVALGAGLLTFAALELLAGAGLGLGGLDHRTSLVGALRAGMREIGPLLIGYACFTVAGFAVARAGRLTRAGWIIAVGGAVCAVGYAVLELWSHADGEGEWLGYPIILVLPAGLAVAAFVAAGRTVARKAACAGLILVGFGAIALYDQGLAHMALWRPVEADAFLEPGYMVSLARPGDPVSTREALTSVLPLGIAAIVTVGCLRRVGRATG